MQSIYQLTAEHRALLDMDAGDDQAFAEALAETLSAQSEQIEEKIEATIFVAKEIEANAEACKAEAKRLQERAKQFERNAEACKERVIWAMGEIGADKIKRPLLTVTRVKPKQVVFVDDEDKIPRQFMSTKVTRSPDKRLILESRKRGEKVPGCHVDYGKPSLRIS